MSASSSCGSASAFVLENVDLEVFAEAVVCCFGNLPPFGYDERLIEISGVLVAAVPLRVVVSYDGLGDERMEYMVDGRIYVAVVSSFSVKGTIQSRESGGGPQEDCNHSGVDAKWQCRASLVGVCFVAGSSALHASAAWLRDTACPKVSLALSESSGRRVPFWEIVTRN